MWPTLHNVHRGGPWHSGYCIPACAAHAADTMTADSSTSSRRHLKHLHSLDLKQAEVVSQSRRERPLTTSTISTPPGLQGTGLAHAGHRPRTWSALGRHRLSRRWVMHHQAGLQCWSCFCMRFLSASLPSDGSIMQKTHRTPCQYIILQTIANNECSSLARCRHRPAHLISLRLSPTKSHGKALQKSTLLASARSSYSPVAIPTWALVPCS